MQTTLRRAIAGKRAKGTSNGSGGDNDNDNKTIAVNRRFETRDRARQAQRIEADDANDKRERGSFPILGKRKRTRWERYRKRERKRQR